MKKLKRIPACQFGGRAKSDCKKFRNDARKPSYGPQFTDPYFNKKAA